MLKKSFIVFLIVIGAAIAGVVIFIQSAKFAGLIKSTASKNIPPEWGIQGDFSGLSIGVFPPAILIENPRITVAKRNIVNLPEGSQVQAEKIRLRFFPLQLLSGNIRVHEAAIINGEATIIVDPNQFEKKERKKKNPFDLKWEDLVQINSERVKLINMKVHFKWLSPLIEASFTADELEVSQDAENEKINYGIGIKLKDLSAVYPKDWTIPSRIDKAEAHIEVNEDSVNVTDIRFQSPGVDLALSGKILGNILKPESLLLDGNTHFEGDLNGILSLFALGKTLRKADGLVFFDGNLKGDLIRFASTAKANGKLTAKNIHVSHWYANNLEVEGDWTAPATPSLGEVVVKSALIQTDMAEKSGARSAGSGGTIKVGAFRLPLNFREAFKVPIELNQAHLHWLASSVIEDIFPLDLRATGTVLASFEPKTAIKNWSLKSDLNLTVPRLVLDTATYQKSNSDLKILDVEHIAIKGQVEIDEKSVRPQGVLVSTGKNNFEVHGKVDFKNGYELQAQGVANLEDLGAIAEIPIKGSGPMIVTVKGPASNVTLDFVSQLRGVEYLNLELGDFSGKISYLDLPNTLRITGGEIKKNSLEYSAEGDVAFGRKDALKLHFGIKRGDVHELIDVFNRLTSDFWWFPSSIYGATSGAITLSGGLKLSEMVVESSLEGQDWEYFGEKFRTVSLKGGYDRGRYWLNPFKARKYQGTVEGSISFSQKEGIDWSFRSNELILSDLDHVGGLNVPIKGRIFVQSTGSQQTGSTQSESRLQISDYSLRGRSLQQSELIMRSDRGVLTLNGVAHGDQGKLAIQYGFKPGDRSSINIQFNRFDFTPLLLVLNPELSFDKKLEGFISGEFDLKFPTNAAQEASGLIRLEEYALNKENVQIGLNSVLQTRIENGSFTIRDFILKDRDRTNIQLNLNAHTGKLAGTIAGKADLRMLEFVTPIIAESDGWIDLDLDVGGVLAAPEIDGSGKIVSGQISVMGLETPFMSIFGNLSLKSGLVYFRDIESKFGGGRIVGSGTMELFKDRFPKLDIRARLSNNKIKVFPFQQAIVRGELTLKGERMPYLAGGQIFIDNAISREKILTPGRFNQRRSARYTPGSSGMVSSNVPFFKMDIGVRADDGILIQNDLFDAEMKSDLRLLNTLDAPRILGQAEFIKGKLLFKDHEFLISNGKITFDNPAVLNPRVELSSRTETNNIKVRLDANGPADKLNIQLTSDPVMPESEIISLLALGFTSDEFKKLGVSDQTAVQQGEAASLLLHSFDFNRDVKEKTGVEIQVDEAVGSQKGTSIFRPQTEADSVAAPKVVLKKRVGKKVDLSVGSTVGVGTSSAKEVNAEVHVTPGMSVIGVWNTFEGVDTTDTQTSYGVDLKFQKRFK